MNSKQTKKFLILPKQSPWQVKATERAGKINRTDDKNLSSFAVEEFVVDGGLTNTTDWLGHIWENVEAFAALVVVSLTIIAVD